MHHVLRIMTAVAVTAAIILPTDAQLKLGSPKLPKLDSSSYTATLAAELDEEISENLILERGASPDEFAALRAGSNLRLISFDLLMLADKEGDGGNVAFITGLTLAQGRFKIDNALNQFVNLGADLRNKKNTLNNSDADRHQRISELLSEFNQWFVTVAESIAVVEPVSIDKYLQSTLYPLFDAVSIIEASRQESHWIDSKGVAGMMSGKADVTDISTGISELRIRVETIVLREDTKAVMIEVVDFLQRGWKFAEFRKYIRSYYELISSVLDYADNLGKSDWLDEELKNTCMDELHNVIVLFRDKATRDQSIDKLTKCGKHSDILGRLNILASFRNARIHPDLIKQLYAARTGIGLEAGETAISDEYKERIDTVIDQMIAFRELSASELRGEMRVTARKLENMYLDSEGELVIQLENAAAMNNSFSDPAITSLFVRQRQLLEDIKRVRSVPSWIELITEINAKAKSGFEAQTRKMTTWLLDPTRRQDAVLAMQQFEQQSEMFLNIPFEEKLRERGVDASAMTGGQEEELFEVITGMRVSWAYAWSAGDAGSESANNLLLIYRLMQTVNDMVEITRRGGNAQGLNAWSAWEVSNLAINQALNDVPNRIKLGVRAAIEDNYPELEKQLVRINEDATLVKLVGRIGYLSASEITNYTNNATGILAQVAYLPHESAWLIHKRYDIAELCRYSVEGAHAGTLNREELVETCSDYVKAIADDLLKTLGERTTAIPDLSGFDGSDPTASQRGN